MPAGIARPGGLTGRARKGSTSLSEARRTGRLDVGNRVANQERLLRGVTEGAANSILIKPNQIGTLTETLDAITRRNLELDRSMTGQHQHTLAGLLDRVAAEHRDAAGA